MAWQLGKPSLIVSQGGETWVEAVDTWVPRLAPGKGLLERLVVQSREYKVIKMMGLEKKKGLPGLAPSLISSSSGRL